MQHGKNKKHKRLGSTGKNHWNWSHGNATKLTRQEQADTNCRLRYLCDIGIQYGFMMPSTKFLGRPPKDYIKANLKEVMALTYVMMKIEKK
jgi:hypothetical protein